MTVYTLSKYRTWYVYSFSATKKPWLYAVCTLRINTFWMQSKQWRWACLLLPLGCIPQQPLSSTLPMPPSAALSCCPSAPLHAVFLSSTLMLSLSSTVPLPLRSTVSLPLRSILLLPHSSIPWLFHISTSISLLLPNSNPAASHCCPSKASSIKCLRHPP